MTDREFRLLRGGPKQPMHISYYAVYFSMVLEREIDNEEAAQMIKDFNWRSHEIDRANGVQDPGLHISELKSSTANWWRSQLK